MMTDQELLERYAYHGQEAGGEGAFRELVRRHIDLVYGLSRSQLQGNASLAEEVTQAVFTALAMQARRHGSIRHLSAWLYATTRFTVAHTVRAERRRQDREQKAYVMSTLLAETTPPGDAEIPAALLEEALSSLPDEEREALVLRFFEGASFATIGRALNVSEDAARMRVTRTLEELRDQFIRKGVTSTATAIGAAFTGQALAAPAGLAATVASGALGTLPLAAVVGGGSKLVLLSFMSTKTLPLAVSLALLLAFGYAGLEHGRARQKATEADLAAHEQARLAEEVRQLTQRVGAAEARALTAETQLEETLRNAAKSSPLAAKVPAEVVSAEETARRASQAAKLMALKPQLEAGRPIRGAVLVLLNGKPSEQPVGFVVGRETTVASDEGTYRIQPALNRDGTVKYGLTLIKKDPAGGADLIVQQPTVVQTPWAGFGIRIDDKAILEFDNDEREP